MNIIIIRYIFHSIIVKQIFNHSITITYNFNSIKILEGGECSLLLE